MSKIIYISPRRAAIAMLYLSLIALCSLFFVGCKKDHFDIPPRVWPPRLEMGAWRVDSLINFDGTRRVGRVLGLDRDTFAIFGDSARYSIFYARVYRGNWQAVEWEDNTWLYTLHCPDTSLLFLVETHTAQRLVLRTLDQNSPVFSDVLYLQKMP